MINRVSAALRRIQSDLAQVLDAEQITEVCSEVGYRFRKRILDPTTTIHLFVTQIVNGNFAVARLEEFTDKQFSEAAYCNARGRLPVQVLQTLLKRVGSALQPILNDAGRWRKHRTFHIDGSAFSMPDTEELLTAFGQPGRQRAGCGFPVAHLLTLFHAGTGFLMKALAAPLRTHDMKEAALANIRFDPAYEKEVARGVSCSSEASGRVPSGPALQPPRPTVPEGTTKFAVAQAAGKARPVGRVFQTKEPADLDDSGGICGLAEVRHRSGAALPSSEWSQPHACDNASHNSAGCESVSRV